MSTRPLHRRLLATAAVLAMAVGTAACGANGAETTEDGKVVVRYQSSPGAVTLPEIAAELGYFEDVELKLVGETTGGPESLRALSTDQVDIANAFQGAIAKTISSGAPVKALIASYGSVGDVASPIVVRDDGSVNEARDLIGKKVALNTLGANSEAVLDTYLEQAGLTQEEIAQVTLVPLPSASLETSLRKKQVDAFFYSAALYPAVEARGGVKVLTTDIDVVGPYTGGSYALHEKFIEGQPEATEDFVQGVAKAFEWTQTHSVEEVREFVVGFLREQGRDDVIPAVQNWIGFGVPTVGGWLRDEDFTAWIDWLEKSGSVEAGSLELSDVYTNEFNPYADKGEFVPEFVAAKK
ncbi:ABC transporter substrate-binding protein [Nocardioides yefusunii]|uniref:ABC transporter substrate-binding protein n=1 Tax=Nocardioides yefusunii TaxID=2500546 RepID=A0ABW1QXG7_9ACTN|nr:ABC transporter substrate-binding protein [Nocardioides yefusunii]